MKIKTPWTTSDGMRLPAHVDKDGVRNWGVIMNESTESEAVVNLDADETTLREITDNSDVTIVES